MKSRTVCQDDQDIQQIIKEAREAQAIPFTEDFKPALGRHQFTTFTADSYMAWVRPLVPEGLRDCPPDKKVPIGSFYFQWKTFPVWAMSYGPMGFFFGTGTLRPRKTILVLTPRHGRCSFNDTVHIPQICHAGGDQEVVMSLTPFEVLTGRHGVKKAKGRVLIGGLGMGWFTRKVLERKKVLHVTVIEKDQAVIDAFGFSHPKLEIRQGDIWDQRFSWKEQYHSVLLDVWDNYGQAKDDPRLETHPNLWAWGNVEPCWSESRW